MGLSHAALSAGDNGASLRRPHRALAPSGHPRASSRPHSRPQPVRRRVTKLRRRRLATTSGNETAAIMCEIGLRLCRINRRPMIPLRCWDDIDVSSFAIDTPPSRYPRYAPIRHFAVFPIHPLFTTVASETTRATSPRPRLPRSRLRLLLPRTGIIAAKRTAVWMALAATPASCNASRVHRGKRSNR
ncbi:hypothetical protein ACVMIH_007490 [Bradyrhizobium sp. USDA 4503]